MSDEFPHGDPEVLMHRFIDAAVNDTDRFVELLESIGCPPDSPRGRVMAELVYTIATWIYDQDSDRPDDDRPVGCTCVVPAVPETIVMLLIITDDSRNWHATEHVLKNLCHVCTARALVLSSRAHARILNDTNPGWRPMAENQLKGRLDEENPVTWVRSNPNYCT
jgi:hypothetical protein